MKLIIDIPTEEYNDIVLQDVYRLKELGEHIRNGVLVEDATYEDCISREEAIRVAEQGQVQGYEWQFKKLCTLPSVQPQRLKGTWIVDKGIKRNNVYCYTVHCDKCGHFWDYSTDKKDSIPSDYCPNCGAKMAESEE